MQQHAAPAFRLRSRIVLNAAVRLGLRLRNRAEHQRARMKTRRRITRSLLGALVCCNGVLGGWSRYALQPHARIPDQSIVAAGVSRRHLIQSCGIFIDDVVRGSDNEAEAVAPNGKAVSRAKSAIEGDAYWHACIAANSNEAKVASCNGCAHLSLGSHPTPGSAANESNRSACAAFKILKS